MRAVTAHVEMPAIFRGLAFEDPAVRQVQAEHISSRAVGHRIELDDGDLTVAADREPVAHTPKRPRSAMQTADSCNGLDVRHIARSLVATMKMAGPCTLGFAPCEN